MSGLSHIFLGHFRRGGWWVCLDSTNRIQRHYLLHGLVPVLGMVGTVDLAFSVHGLGLGFFLVQPISPFRAIAKGKIQGRGKTYKRH